VHLLYLFLEGGLVREQSVAFASRAVTQAGGYPEIITEDNGGPIMGFL